MLFTPLAPVLFVLAITTSDPAGTVGTPVAAPATLTDDDTGTNPPAGYELSTPRSCVIAPVIVEPEAVPVVSVVAPTFTNTAAPVVGVVVALDSETFVTFDSYFVNTVTAAAFAGATEVKPPNARAATATADTFFNEIVFTIFLSFSRFQVFPGPGWWLKRPPH